MLETLTVITLITLFMIFFRPGTTPPLDSPLVIERPGQYHMTLAPQLNLAQPFVEAVAAQVGTPNDAAQSSETQSFEVRDKQVVAHGNNFYLLAITQRNGMLYFQAVSPLSGDESGHFNTISEFANGTLMRFPASGAHNPALDEQISAAVQTVAQQRGINIKPLAQ